MQMNSWQPAHWQFISPERHEFVLSSKSNQDRIRTIFSKKLNNDVLDVIMNFAYPINTGCECRKYYTCSLCIEACCTLAQRGHCMCRVRLTCPDHGWRCVGNHD